MPAAGQLRAAVPRWTGHRWQAAAATTLAADPAVQFTCATESGRAAVVVAIEDHEEEATEGWPIRIITGRGLNSDGKAPVRPAVLELLGRAEYAHLTREDDAKSKGGAIFASWPVQ